MCRWRLLILLVVVASSGCWQDATGPDSVPRARLVVAAAFPSTVTEVVTVTRLRLQIERTSGDRALDTTVTVAPDADSVAVDVSVTLQLVAPGTPPRERFLVRATLSGPGGDPLFESGPDEVEAVGGTAPNELSAALRYVGIGANAQSVVIAPPPLSVASGDSVQLVATALGAGAQAIPGTPVLWTSLDPTIMTVNAAGRAVALTQAGMARVMARLLTGQSDTVVLNVLGPPANVIVLQGNGQSAAVDAAITGPVRVRVTDALGVPRSGIPVTFVVTAGGGALGGATQLTNAAGEATLGGWTLGPTPTVNEIEARAGTAPPGVIRAEATWIRRLRSARNAACALAGGGVTRCWGENFQGDYGHLASTIPSSPTPVTVPMPALVELGYSGGGHTCGLTSSGSAVCFGRWGQGQLGGGVLGSGPAAVTVVGGITWKQLATSVLTSCGVSTAGAAYCWGHNQHGEVGSLSVPLLTMSSSPVLVDGGHTFSSVASGWLHACALTVDRLAYCWGSNSAGQLGIGTADVRMQVPSAVAGGYRFESITAGALHTCGITIDKQALCWGFNGTGQLGDGTTTARNVPTPVSGGRRFSAIAAGVGSSSTSGSQLGDAHTCALTESGEPWCWGYNANGQLGDGTTATSLIPVQVLGGLQLSGLSLSWNSTCGTRGDAIWCWGWNDNGQLGNGTSLDRSVPNQIAGGFAFTNLAGGANHSCGLQVGGTIVCWGSNSGSELGTGNTELGFLPIPAAGGQSFSLVTNAGFVHTCGITTTGAAVCWGNNSFGGIGDGTVVTRSSPVPIVGGPPFVTLSAGWYHTCGLTVAGAAWCWGQNQSGQLGDGTTTTRSSPAPMSGAPAFSAISPGGFHGCALTVAGAAYCWGDNSFGAVGDGSIINRLTPVAVQGGPPYSAIRAADSFSCGLTAGGAAWCWGSNNVGQLGDGTNIGRSVPAPVAGGHTFVSLTASSTSDHACGLTAAGVAWCWGYNIRGQLGDGTTTNRSQPVPVAGGHVFSAIRAGRTHTCGITVAGPTWCWGEGTNGQLGYAIPISPPVRVNGF